MILRGVTFAIIKWLTLLFFLVTILLTTPWGTRLTLSLLNNIEGVNFDYKAGALVRNIELHAFHLSLNTLDIDVKDLNANIDFSCSWRKKLCIDTLTVASFSLTYLTNNEDKKPKDQPQKTNDDGLFVMPFAIEAQSVNFTQSHLVINKTVIDIEQLSAQVAINASQFTFLQPNVSKVSIALTNTDTTKTQEHKKDTANSIHDIVSTLPKIYLPISLNIQQLFVDKFRIIDANKTTKDSLTNDVLWPYQQSHLTGTWAKSDVNLTNVQTSAKNFSVNHLTLKSQLIPPYKIHATLAAQLDKIALWPEASDSSIDISLQGAFDDLTANITSKGSVILHSKGHINLTDPQLPFTLQLSTDKLPLPLSLAQYATPSSLSLDVSGDTVQQTVNLRSTVNSYGYNNAQLNLSAKHNQGLITLDKLAFNEHDSASQLHLHGKIDFQPDRKSWQLFADSSGFTLPKINLKTLLFPVNSSMSKDKSVEAEASVVETMMPDVINGRLLGKIASNGVWTKSQWSVSVNDTDISGTINNAALSIHGDITVNQSGYFSSGDLAQGTLLIGFNKDKLSLQTFSDNNWDVIGQLSIANITPWYQGVNGSLLSDFTIKGNKKSPVIRLKTKLKNVKWQKFYSPSLEIVASYQPFDDHKTQLTITNNYLEITGNSEINTIQNTVIKFYGDLNQQQLHADWQGDLAGKVKLSGQWHNALNQWQGQVEESALTYKAITWHNSKIYDLNFNVDKQLLLIEKHCWLGNGLDICLPYNASLGRSGDITLALNIDLSLIDELLLPEKVQLHSNVSGEIKTQWTPSQTISVNANFALSSGNITINDEYNEQKVTQWHQGNFSFNFNETQLTSVFQLHDLKKQTLININSKINFIDDFPIDAQIELNQFNLQPFQAVISNVVNLQGHLNAMLTVNGSIKAPLINGSLALDRGEILLSQNPNKLENIKADIQINNNQAKILGEFFIQDDKATLHGQLAWQDDFTLNIDLNADQLQLVFPPQLTMKISPSLNFLLKEKVLKISGNVDVLEGTYNIEKLPEGIINLSDDVIIVDQQGKEVFKENSGLNIETNLRVNIAKTFKVSGQGLESNLFGQLQVSQLQKKPLQLFGSIQSENGTYQAYGQRLTIDKGELNFNGPMSNPYFNLRASRYIRAEDIEVGLQVTGLANSLDMQLFSTPTMESPEMLSYLARGRGLDSGGGNSTAAASMLIGFGVTNSVGLFDQLEKLPLISNIAVDTEGEGDTTQAIISGYIGNRVYLKYGIGVYEPINELTVRLYLLNRFWLEIVSGIEQSSDIYYSFDID